MFKVSIITVCYNSQKTIKDTINSVNDQTYKSIEHIFIDGKSKDKTIDIIKNNSNLNTILISEEDNGIYDAMNKGINLASGEIIVILNSDDVFYENNTLSSIVEIFIRNQNTELIYGNLIITKKNKIIRRWNSGKYIKDSFLKGWCPAHPAFIVKKNVYEKYGSFNLKYKYAADIELMYRLLMQLNCKHFYFNETLIKMRAGGTSNIFKNIILQNFENIKIFKNERKFNIVTFFFNKFIHRLKQFI